MGELEDKNELKKYIGKYILRKNNDYKWMFKLVDVVDNGYLIVTQPLDIYPKPRLYKCGDFLGNHKENVVIGTKDDMRLPTKEEFNLYRKSWRKLIYLGHL